MLTNSVQKQDQILSHQNGTGKLFFQPKLTINQPNDAYEQEADAMANHVMQTPGASLHNSFFKSSVSSVQRKCAHCEEEEKKAQRKEFNNNTTEASAETENYVNSLSGGNALNEKDKAFFESRMGYDLSNVRLHTDGIAVKSAQSVNALAYTSGNDIVFNQNQCAPETDTGKRLLAHELTHVVQRNNKGMIQRTPNPRPQSPTDLTSYSEANRQGITYDPSTVALNPRDHFQQGIVETPRRGFDIDYVFAGTIAAWLQKPLRSIARAIFSLQSADVDPVIVNTTLIKALDLSSFHENNDSSKPAGPDTRFRFTCKEFDASGSGAGKTRNVQIIIENINPAAAIPNASETPAQRIARFAKDYGFTRVDPMFFPDDAFNKILMAVSLVPDNLLRSVSGIPFNRVIGQALGPQGEAAEYSWTKQGNNYTRVINVYDDALKPSVTTDSLAFLMTHEIGHAIAHRPVETGGATAQKDLSDETGTGSFREAATKDGGLQKAITAYGRTNWSEYFAEAFTMFINQPDTLKLLRPNVYAYFLTKFPAQTQPQQATPSQTKP
jgi:hypothetical protein